MSTAIRSVVGQCAASIVFACAVIAPASPLGAGLPNILVIVIDDIGIDRRALRRSGGMRRR